MKLEIYCSNLHHGGAVTNCAAMLDSLPELLQTQFSEISTVRVLVSPAVRRNMSMWDQLNRLHQVEPLIRADAPGWDFALPKKVQVDARIVVFGPDYQRQTGATEILGFADGTLFFPTPLGVATSPTSAKLKEQAKNQIKRLLLRRYDRYIVQTQAFAGALRTKIRNRPITIVPNSAPSLFRDPSQWDDIDLGPRDSDIMFAYPARGYPHKNHEFIGKLATELGRQHQVAMKVYTTLRDSEWQQLSDASRKHCVNVGELSLQQCPSLYLQTDATIFPSLNEVYSATPLESMALGRPVYASDRYFVTDTCGDHAIYFDPLDPVQAARVIAEAPPGTISRQHLDAAREFARALPDPSERMARYLRLAING